jgi:hypothetical protein
MRSKTTTLTFLILAASLLSFIAPTEGAQVRLATFSGSVCGIPDSEPTFVQVYVFVSSYSDGLTGVRLSAPVPECVSGMIWLGDVPVFSATSGDSQNGVEIDFGSCNTTHDFHVLTINYITSGTSQGCCIYPVLAHPQAQTGQVEFVDCSDATFAGEGISTYVAPLDQWPPLVENRSPIDGSSQCAFDTKLNWTVDRCDCLLSTLWIHMFFGTSSDPPLVADGPNENQFDPGPLQPGTTYYWKIKAFAGGSLSTTTPVWSFTTSNSVAVQPTTWGRIKGLYER